MEEVEKVSKALQLVERYESYLFRRVGGVIFIIWGILGPLIGFFALKAHTFSELLGMRTSAFMLLVPFVIWLAGFTITVYMISSATIITSRMRKVPSRRHLPHLVTIFFVWIISFILAGILSGLSPMRITIVFWLWAGGCASSVTYLVIRKISDYRDSPEVLLIGLILLIGSIPIANVSNVTLAEVAALLTCAISFVAGGLYSIITASKHLTEEGEWDDIPNALNEDREKLE